MKTKKGYHLRTVGSENIIIASGEENVDFTRVISLNESAARLWKAIEGKPFTADELTELLLSWYDTDEETAGTDVQTLLTSWQDAGLIEP